jgi:hypothetical protein
MENPGFNVKCFFDKHPHADDGPDYQEHYWHVFSLREVLEEIIKSMIDEKYLIEGDQIIVYDVLNNVRYNFGIIKPGSDFNFDKAFNLKGHEPKSVILKRFQLLSKAGSVKESPSMAKYKKPLSYAQ